MDAALVILQLLLCLESLLAFGNLALKFILVLHSQIMLMSFKRRPES